MAVVLGTEDIPLHPATTTLARWRARIVFAALVGIGPLVALIARQWLWAAVGVAGAGLLAWAIYRYQLAYLARLRCTLLPDGLKVTRGIWWRNESFVPRSRIQHTDVNQGPLARRLGIATLLVHTAGTHLASLGVSGLPHQAAIGLRDRLLKRDGRDGV